MKFIFTQDFPDLVHPDLEALLQRERLLFPLWMQEVLVVFDTRMDSLATMVVKPNYQRCQLTISPSFLEMSADERRETIIHEILHCFNTPLKREACFALDSVLPDGEDDRLKNVLVANINDAMEKITQDFTYSILRYVEALTVSEVRAMYD